MSAGSSLIQHIIILMADFVDTTKGHLQWSIGDNGFMQFSSQTHQSSFNSKVISSLSRKKPLMKWVWGLGDGDGSVTCMCVWLFEIHHIDGQYNTNLLNVRVSDSIWWFISRCYLNLYDFITLPCIPKPLNHMYGIYFTLSAGKDVQEFWMYMQHGYIVLKGYQRDEIE